MLIKMMYPNNSDFYYIQQPINKQNDGQVKLKIAMYRLLEFFNVNNRNAIKTFDAGNSS